jgi:hypothetical protein
VTEAVRRRRAQLVTAALRAGYAWSVRHDEVRAWRELAAMTGVVMNALGPGNGPVTPVALVAALRVPLGGLLPPLPDGAVEEVDRLVVLDGDTLTDAASEVGCDCAPTNCAGDGSSAISAARAMAATARSAFCTAPTPAPGRSINERSAAATGRPAARPDEHAPY